MGEFDCPCGEKHDETSSGWQATRKLIEGLGPHVVVTVAGLGSWQVSRMYIAMHGLQAQDLPALAEKYGWVPSLEGLFGPILEEALQKALHLKTKAGGTTKWVHVYSYVREETRDQEAIVAMIRLTVEGLMTADLCGEESGTILYEAEPVNLGRGSLLREKVAPVANDFASRLAEAWARGVSPDA